MTRILLILSLAGVLLTPATGALRCRYWPVRGRSYCWCYDRGWHTAPALLCKVGGAQ